jgi:hypothetical protein
VGSSPESIVTVFRFTSDRVSAQCRSTWRMDVQNRVEGIASSTLFSMAENVVGKRGLARNAVRDQGIHPIAVESGGVVGVFVLAGDLHDEMKEEFLHRMHYLPALMAIGNTHSNRGNKIEPRIDGMKQNGAAVRSCGGVIGDHGNIALAQRREGTVF